MKLIADQLRDIKPNRTSFEVLLAEYPKPLGNWQVMLEKGTTRNLIYYAVNYNDIWVHVAILHIKPKFHPGGKPTSKDNRTFKLRS